MSYKLDVSETNIKRAIKDLLEQNDACRKLGHCLYYKPDRGHKCIVGHALFSNDARSLALQLENDESLGGGIVELITAKVIVLVNNDHNVDKYDLRDLQYIHDNVLPVDWPEHFNEWLMAMNMSPLENE